MTKCKKDLTGTSGAASISTVDNLTSPHLNLMDHMILMRNQMNIGEIVRQLNEIADFNILGAGAWPVEGEAIFRLGKILKDLGVEEKIAGGTRNTALGNELDLSLMIAFMGGLDALDVVHVLLDRGLLDELDAEAIWSLSSEEKMTREIRRHVRRAYLKFCNPSTHLS